MRVLWLTASYKLVKKEGHSDFYYGGGWVSSLQRLVDNCADIKLGVCYLSDSDEQMEDYLGTSYYPIKTNKLSKLQKLKFYYGGYRKIDDQAYVRKIKDAIDSFKPDVIHLFGIENPMATILGLTSVPVIVHLQGFLGPYDNAFFPQGFNKWSFLFPPTKQEWLIRNGIVFAKNSICVKGQFESRLFKRMRFCMGRTSWDQQVSNLMSPESVYFHVDEVLRESFYSHAGQWKIQDRESIVIVSTLSETVYKGLDLILKTAKMLKEQSRLEFKWQVVGIKKESSFTRFFEKTLGICGDSVDVDYMGSLDENSLCNILLKADIYVHPSYIDNSPNSLCEAQMLGLPVIATYVGGVPSLIEHGKTGFLIPSNAPYELCWYLSKYHDEKEMYSCVAHDGYEAARKRHDKNTIIDDLLKAYSAIM